MFLEKYEIILFHQTDKYISPFLRQLTVDYVTWYILQQPIGSLASVNKQYAWLIKIDGEFLLVDFFILRYKLLLFYLRSKAKQGFMFCD